MQQPTRDLLERYFAEKIYSLKQGLDEVYEPSAGADGETLTQLQSLKAFWNIIRTETGEIIELFGEINPATLNPNHRKIMNITKHYVPILNSLDIINEEKKDSPKCCEFAKTSIQYLMSLHTILMNDEKITEKEKSNLEKVFLEKQPYAVKQKSKRRTKSKDVDDQSGS